MLLKFLLTSLILICILFPMRLDYSTHPSNPTLNETFQIAGVRYGVDWKLAKAVAIVESELFPRAVSHKGAIGIMQIHPSLADWYRISKQLLFNSYINIHIGASYLSLLTKRYGLKPGLQMYNLGETKYHNKMRNIGYYNRVLKEYQLQIRIWHVMSEAKI